MPQTGALRSPRAFDLVCFVCLGSPCLPQRQTQKGLFRSFSFSQYRAGFKVTPRQTVTNASLLCGLQTGRSAVRR